MVSIKFLNGYWTVFVGAQAITTHATIEAAMEFVR